MKLRVFLIVLVLLYVFFFFLIRAFQKNYLKNLISKKHFLLIIFLYLLGFSYFNYSVAKLFFNSFYSKTYDIKGINNEINSKQQEISMLNLEIDSINEEINSVNDEELSAEINKLESEVNKLKSEKEKLNKTTSNKKSEYYALADEYKILLAKTEYKIENFPLINQHPKYPNGCEIASLYMMLKYQGVDVGMETLANSLDKGPAPYWEGNTRYGANPENAFVGDPRLTNGQGYGVYQKPIIKLANNYKSGMKDITGSNLNTVLGIVKQGKPVQVWASVNLRNSKVCASWLEPSTGVKINWLCGLHSMVVIGYNYENVIIADPYYGKVRSFSKSKFEKIYNLYGKRAIYYE